MKKKLALLLLAAVSCGCFAIGFSACGGGETAHTMTFTAAKAATCTEAGNSAYYYCSDCGKYFSDADGTNEIELSSTVINALGHDYEAEFKWTPATDGYTVTATQYCKTCNGEGETVEATVTSDTTAATCYVNGSTVYTATAAFTTGTETDTKTDTILAGHTYSEDWTYDDGYHWHKATCEHTDEISGKATHTYVKDSSGNYACSVCGHTRTEFITSSADALAVGTNFIILNPTTYDDDGLETASSYISGVTLTAAASGTYTFTLPTDCQALVYFDLTTKLGDAGYGTSNVYTLSFDIQAGGSISMDFRPAEGVEFSSEYIFCLTIDYEYKYIADVGSDENPYAFTNPDSYGGDSTTATLEVGESYYFTVTSDSDTLTEISFSNSDATAFELYVNGTKVDYGAYIFSCGTTTTTFYIKNISSGELSNTIHCAEYSPSLAVDAANELTLSSILLDSDNSITYTVSIPASSTYNITLGSGTDENVAIYYIANSSLTFDDPILILGSGATATTYQLENTSSRGNQTYYLTITYTGATIPDSFKVYVNFEKVEASSGDNDDDDATYTAITLGETLTMDFSNASTFYYSYTPAATESGNYTLTFTFTNTAFYGTLVGLAVVTANGSTITGSYDKDGVYFVMAGGASEYKISITMTNATLTLTGTLTSGGEVIEVTIPELELGANTVANSTLYSFTSTDAGTYTFTLSGAGDYAVVSSSDSYTDYIDYYNAQGEDNNINPFTLELEANQTINLYISNANDTFTLTISNS